MAGVTLLALATVAYAQVQIPSIAPVVHDVRPGAGWTVKALSDYDAGVSKTAGDTPVYIFDSGKPGGTVFVAGGTHANEVAGFMAATVLVEHARVASGRLIVIPHANNSAISWVEPTWKGPSSFVLKTASGVRTFRFGTRLTKPEHQGEPDPPRKDPAGGAEYAFDNEARNLDRSYPGKAAGNLTERVAFAIMSLLKRERVDVAFDFHEANVDSRLAMMIVANPKNIDLGAAAVLALEGKGLEMKLEPSSSTFRGLSHREWGDATEARAFLFETPSPAFDQKTVGDVVNDPVWPLARRVGVHLATMMAVLEAYNSEAPAARRVALTAVPDVDSLTKSGLGAVLK
jgi:predicted deacylase